MPLPTARSAVPMAAVVLPLPGPVLMRIRPLRVSAGAGGSFKGSPGLAGSLEPGAWSENPATGYWPGFMLDDTGGRRGW